MVGHRMATVTPLSPEPAPGSLGNRSSALSNVHPFRRLKPGAVLFHEGDEPRWIYEVVSGMLKLSRLTRNGRELVIDFLAAGDVANLSSDGVCTCTAEAVGETWVRALPGGVAMASAARSDEVARTILYHAMRREAASQRRIMLLCLRHPHQRVAAFLLDCAQRQSASEPRDHVHVAVPMARRDLADYLALAPETLSRVMRRLREETLIETHDCHDIELSDVEGLAVLSNEE